MIDVASGHTREAEAARLAALFVTPVVALFVSPDWAYSAIGLIDAWLYHGYFHRFPDFVSTLFPGTYYGTRLGWILPGYAAYHTLPPHAANLALHLSFHYVALLSLYRTATLVSTPGAALVAAAAFGTSLPVLVALGWDYVDGAVITYCSIGVWAMVESRTRARVPLLMAGGAASAAMVHSNLGAALLLPIVAIAYAVSRSGRIGVRDIWPLAAGAVLSTGLMGAASVAAGGPLLFFMPSVHWTAASLGTETFQRVDPFAWPGASRFAVPALGLAFAFGALLARRTVATRLAALSMAWVAGIFLAFDWTFDAALLQTQYYISWILPFCFLALAAALDTRPISSRQAVVLWASAVGLQVLALTAGPALLLGWVEAIPGARPTAEVSIVTGAVAASFLLSWRSPGIWGAAGLVLALALTTWLIAPVVLFKPSPLGRSQFDAIQHTLSFIEEHVPRDERPLFWIQSGPRSPYYHSVASTHLYLYALVGAGYPALPDDATTAPRYGATVTPGSTVVVVSDTAIDQPAVIREFERFQLKASIGPSARVRVRDVAFVLTIVRITERGT